MGRRAANALLEKIISSIEASDGKKLKLSKLPGEGH
jgi:hypothetical protein